MLVGGVAGAELGDGAAVLGLGGELAYPGCDRGADEYRRLPGVARPGVPGGAGKSGRGMISPW